MLLRALEMASLREFVESLPDGLDTIIGERGFKISGGQRQRLAIARAFLKDSKIVILDEATSAVDSESENQIHRAMELLMAGRTVFLIAHRLRSAVTADLIVVMDRGRIVETGRHAELMRREARTPGSSTSKRADYRWNRTRIGIPPADGIALIVARAACAGTVELAAADLLGQFPVASKPEMILA